MLPVSTFVQSPPYFIREPEPLRKEFAGQKAERFEVTGFKHTDMFLEVLRREETIGALASKEKEELPLPPAPSTQEEARDL